MRYRIVQTEPHFYEIQSKYWFWFWMYRGCRAGSKESAINLLEQIKEQDHFRKNTVYEA